MVEIDQLALRFLPPGGEMWSIAAGYGRSPIDGDRRHLHEESSGPLCHLGLVWVLAGRGWLDHEGRRWPLRAGSVFWRIPGLPQANGSDEDQSWEECFLILPAAMLPVIEAAGRSRWPEPVAMIGSDVELRRRWHRLIASLHGIPSTAPERALAPVLGLALEIMHRVSAGDPERRLVAEACALLESPAGERLRLSEVARRLGSSHQSLRLAFARCLGRKPAQWRAERRIERACRLLGEGHSAIEVARRLGYSSPQAFHRAFVSMCGIPPGGWTRG
jgi:AraC-like DNA-binding protein